jgi:hypothetical protein
VLQHDVSNIYVYVTITIKANKIIPLNITLAAHFAKHKSVTKLDVQHYLSTQTAVQLDPCHAFTALAFVVEISLHIPCCTVVDTLSLFM